MDNLAETLKQKLGLVDKSITQQKLVVEKRIEHGQLAKDLRPKLELIISKTKELQSLVRFLFKHITYHLSYVNFYSTFIFSFKLVDRLRQTFLRSTKVVQSI